MSSQEATVTDSMGTQVQRPGQRTSRVLSHSGSISALSIPKSRRLRAHLGLQHIGRRTLGIFLLLVTVVLWTVSNFLASYMFADNSFSKPYFVTYMNTSFFAISLIPIFFRLLYQHGISYIRTSMIDYWQAYRSGYKPKVSNTTGGEGDEEDSMLAPHTRLLVEFQSGSPTSMSGGPVAQEGPLNLPETARLSLEFCLLWFAANYLVAACLEHTSVASSTILTSTSSIWTLILSAIVRVEQFSYRKLIGVLTSLAGIVLISSVDLSAKDNDKNRGNFPHKSQGEIALGDAMAFGSAALYGIYTVVMKKRIGNEDRVDMPLFFGLVGLFNVLFLWPGLLILHFTGAERFSLPPTGKIWSIVLLNSSFSFISDYCWAYAMLLTTPLVVTVGISMAIPLSLVGQMIISAQYSSALYWVGALIVLLSFLFINHESRDDDDFVVQSEEDDTVA